MNGVNPLMASIIRWVAIVVIVAAIAYAGARQGGVSNLGGIWIAIGVAGPVALGALGYGAYDQRRAATGQVKDSDIGAK
jgi:multisubunit Na+/H+ antiporter MnhG subunit